MFIVFDIGGTKMRMATSNDGESLGKVKIVETPGDFESAVPVFKEFLDENLSSNNFICCGLPGTFDKNRTIMLTAGHLPFWINKPIKETLIGLSKTQYVELENDANLAGLGESKKGSGRGFEVVGFMTFGTGVGGVRIVEGKIDKYSSAVEPGHQIIDLDGTVAGKNITLDSLAGGAGIKNRYGKKGEDIRDPHVWMDIEKIIAVGVANTILHWSPDVMVLGGSLMQNEFVSVNSIEKYANLNLKIINPPPPIKKGELGDNAGLIGGIEYIKQKITTDRS